VGIAVLDMAIGVRVSLSPGGRFSGRMRIANICSLSRGCLDRLPEMEAPSHWDRWTAAESH